MNNRRKSIQTRLIQILLLVLLPIMVIQAYMCYTLFQERKAAAFQTNLELSRGVAKTFERFVKEVLHQELAIGIALTLRPPISAKNQSQILLKSRADNPGIWEFFWASPSGVVLSATGSQFEGMRLDDRDYFRKIIAGQDYVISDLLLSRTTGKPSFTISRGIRDDKGALLGIVVAGILPERLDEELGVKRILGGGFALVDTKGMMVYRYPAIDQTWEERNWIKQYPQFGDALKGKEVAETVYAPFERKSRLVGFTPVPTIGWAASAGQREEEVAGPIWAAISKSALLFGSILVAAFLLALVFSQKISNSVGALRSYALALGRGEEREKAPVQSVSEFKDLADAFDTMAENVRRRETALRESEGKFRQANELLEAVTKGTNVIIAAQDSDLRYAFFNTAYAAEIKRLTGKDIRVGSSMADLFADQPNQLAVAEREWHDALAGNTTNKRLEFGDSEVYRRVYNVLHTPIRDANGHIVGAGEVAYDVTAQVKAEEENRKLLAAVQEEKDRLLALLNSMQDEVWFADAEKRITLVNPAVFKEFGSKNLHGKEVEKIAGSFEVLRPDGTLRPTGEAPPLRALGGEVLKGEEEIVRTPATGELRHRQVSAAPVRDAGGNIIGSVSVVRDITERRRAEQALVEMKNILAEGQRIAHLGTFEYVADTRTTGWSDEEYRIYGLDPAGPSPAYDVILAKSIHPDDATLLHQTFSAAMQSGSLYELEHRIVRPDGSVRWVYDRAYPHFDQNGKLVRYVGATLDITDRKRAEEALRKANEELELRIRERTEELERSQHRLQNLSSQLLLAQEKERKRVALELHDGLLSELAAMKFLLEGKVMQLDQGKSVNADELRRVSVILGTTMKEARRIMTNMHPSVLDELGFIAAMRWMCGEYQKSYPHISIQTEIAASEEDISDGIRVVIFRVLQEALNNFAKHGNGRRVEISLAKTGGIFSFTIRDDGQGFDMEKAQMGLGIESMRERVELSGGEFQIESIIGQGTFVRAIWIT
jgi:PAS domain S-box-containing protein